MNSTNILYLIASGLEFRDLLALAQVNKHCLSVTDRQELWRRECFRMFMSDLELFELPLLTDTQDQITSFPYDSSKIDWKYLVRLGIQAKNGITALSGDYFTKDQSRSFAESLYSVLIDPPLPIPSLRREGRAYPTFLQDLLASKLNNQDTPPFFHMTEPIDSIFHLMNDLDISAHKLFQEFSSTPDRDLLAIARWHLKKPKAMSVEDSCIISGDSPSSTAASLPNEDLSSILISISLTLTSRPLNPSKPFLLQIYSAIIHSITWFCKLVKTVILQHSDGISLLREYVMRWSAYSAAICTVDTSMDSYNLLFNDIYDAICEGLPRKPDYSISRSMVILWRRKVYFPIKDAILTQILTLLNRQREHLIHSLHFKQNKHSDDRSFLLNKKRIESEFYLLQKSIDCLLDLSVNEHTVHITEHRSFYTDGVYSTLHDRVISHTGQFYIHSLNNLRHFDKLSVLNADDKLISRLFVSCTYAEMQKLNLDAKISTVWDHFLKKYIHFDPTKASKIHVRPETLNMILYSELGRKLFSFKPTVNAKQVISVFIEHLIANDELQLINEFLTDFDKISSLEEISEGDLMIENRLNAMGMCLDIPNEELALYSMARDISVHELALVYNTSIE